MNTLQNKIYCIGDSHVRLFEKNDRFVTYWIGPVTAYNLGNKEKLFEILKKIPKESYVMLVVGEIDCRVHLLKQAGLQGRFLIDIVNECVDRFFKVILKIKEMGFKPIVWCITPSSKENNIDKGEYASFGDCQQRNHTTYLFNMRLRDLARENNLPIISVFEELIDNNLNTKTEYYSDAIHISSKVMPLILKELERIK